jgi:hypothetical protein
VTTVAQGRARRGQRCRAAAVLSGNGSNDSKFCELGRCVELLGTRGGK